MLENVGYFVLRFCGRSIPPSLTSTDSLMTVLLVSDSSLSAEGFSAEYVSINASTGIILLQQLDMKIQFKKPWKYRTHIEAKKTDFFQVKSSER